MQFVLSKKNIKDGKAALLIDGGLPSGIYKIASKIQSDFSFLLSSQSDSRL